jgi:uncharacterized RDD family membrane protein YckC
MEKTKQYPKSDLFKRFIALLIDNACCFVVSFIPVIGGITGCVYFLFRDGFEWEFIRYQSLGKKLMKLKVVVFKGDKNMLDLKLSFMRNWLFALPLALSIVPFVGWILALSVGIIVWLIEGIKVITDPKGRRFGDEFADTQVVEETVKVIDQQPSVELGIEKKKYSRTSNVLLVMGTICLVVILGLGFGSYKVYQGIKGVLIDEVIEEKTGDVGEEIRTKMGEKVVEKVLGVDCKFGKLPKHFLKDIPIYEGAKVETSMEFGGKMLSITLRILAPLDEVVKYYKIEFKKRDWEIVMGFTQEGISSFAATKDDGKEIQIQFEENEKETTIDLVYFYGRQELGLEGKKNDKI